MGYIREFFHLPGECPFLCYPVEATQMLMHSHECLEIDWITEGEGSYQIEDVCYPIQEGDIFIINNVEGHMAIPDGSTIRMEVFLFLQEFLWEKEEMLEYLRPFFHRANDFSHRIRRGEPDYERMLSCLQEVKREWKQKERGFLFVIRAQLMLFLSYVNRFEASQHGLEHDVTTFHSSYEKLRPLLDLLHREYEGELNLEMMAQMVGMNKAYMCTFFKSIMKMTIFQYLEQVRINVGCNLLKNTDLEIQEIAVRTGYHSASYFGKIFHRTLQMTPIQYRRRKRKESEELEAERRKVLRLSLKEEQAKERMRGTATEKQKSELQKMQTQGNGPQKTQTQDSELRKTRVLNETE